MKNKQENIFDKIFEISFNEALKLKNPAETFDDPKSIRLYTKFITSLLEINQIKTTFINQYLPKASESIIKSKSELGKSKYKKFILISDDEFKDFYYEVIRLGYIALFHKYEAFTKSISREMDEYGRDLYETDLTLEQFIEKEFDFKIYNNWKISKEISRINWICNSCKHYDGFPKTPLNESFLNHSLDKKLMFTKEDFKNDCEFVYKYCELLIKLINALFAYRLTTERNPNSDTAYLDDEEMRTLKNKYKTNIEGLISLIKNI